MLGAELSRTWRSVNVFADLRYITKAFKGSVRGDTGENLTVGENLKIKHVSVDR